MRAGNSCSERWFYVRVCATEVQVKVFAKMMKAKRKKDGKGTRWRARGQTDKDQDGPFLQSIDSLCSLSSVKFTYTICSCRLVNIFMYTAVREHMQSIIDDVGPRVGGGMRKL